MCDDVPMHFAARHCTEHKLLKLVCLLAQQTLSQTDVEISKTTNRVFRDIRCSQREKTQGECRPPKARAAIPDLMPTRPGRNFQVASSRYTLDHTQQQRTNFKRTKTRHVEKQHIS